MNDTINAILSALETLRAPARPEEADLHAMVAGALDASGIAYRHEAPLGERRRIDFLVGRVGLEVKKGRPSPALLRAQLARYAQSDQIDALVAVCQRAVSLPARLGGKPVRIVALDRLWGVALP